MPVKACQDGGKPGWKCGDGHCYTYTTGDRAGALAAKKAAIRQCVAEGEPPGGSSSVEPPLLAAAPAPSAVVERHNQLILRGYKRADDLEGRLVRLLVPILEHAGDEAATRFRTHATDHLTASAPGVTSTSTMIALYPRPDEAAALEHAPGEPAELLHVTLVYLGDTEGPLTDVVAALRQVAADHAPLAGHVGGIGAFDDMGDGHPGILLPDVPGLAELRHAIADGLVAADQDYARNHGFQAHMTVLYGDEPAYMTFPSRDSFGKPLHFDALHLIRGDEPVAVIPLTGITPLTAAGAGWTAPAGDELVNVHQIVGQLRAKTEPVRVAFLKAVMTPALKAAGLSFDLTNPLTAKVFTQTGSQVTNIAETTQANVMKTVRASYEAGLSVPDTAKAIQAGMRDAAFTRATLIARTELAGAVNGGSLAATRIVAEETGEALYKQWLTAPGALYPRHEDYEGLDGQTVRMDGLFEVGIDQLEYPGDPAGDPEEVCNCRCTLVYTNDPSELTDGAGGGVGSEEATAEAAAAEPAPGRFDIGLANEMKVAVTRDQLAAIDEYASPEGPELNKALRNQESELSPAEAVATTRQLDAVMEKSTLPRPVVVYRSVGADAFEGGAPTAGTTLTDPGFVSTSYRPIAEAFPGAAPLGNVEMEIRVAAGESAIPTAPYLAEAGQEGLREEVILDRDTPMRIVSAERNGDGWNVVAEVGDIPPTLTQIAEPAANITVTSFTQTQVHEMTTGDLWRAMSRNGHAENAARADIATEQTKLIADELWARGDAAGLPANTLRYKDLAGEQHLHSLYSDGHNTIEQMAESARSHGLRQIVVSDHAHLVDAAQWEAQHAEIDALNKSYADRGIPFRVVKGVEANILPDGTLDMTDAELKKFEVVNAGMHVERSVNATERYLRTLDNPRVTTIAHPHTGGDVVDWDALARKAVDKGVALEVNGRDILRLDNGPAAKKMIAAAKQAGARIQIASDAHNDMNLVDTMYGVRFAAKEGVTAEDLIPGQLRDTISVPGEPPVPPDVVAKVRTLELEQGVPGPAARAILGDAPDTKTLYTVKEAPLTVDEKTAIDYYHTPKAFDLNGKLRNGLPLDPQEAAVVRALDAAFVPAPRDMVVYRGVPNAPDVFGHDAAALEQGLLREVSTPGYLSTSTELDDALQFASGISGPGDRPVVEKLVIKKGTPILHVPAGPYGDQHEILLPRDINREFRGVRNVADPFGGGRLPMFDGATTDAGVRDLAVPEDRLVYTADRAPVHDRIVNDLLGDHAAQQQPVALVTAGGPAAGKSVALRAHPDLIPPDSVLVNPDEIMAALPEYKPLYGDPDLANATHEEASDISARLLAAAVEGRMNVVIDGVGDGPPGKFASKLKALKDAGYQVRVMMADTPTNTALARMVQRATADGSPDLNRFVPTDVVKKLYRDAISRMDDWVDQGLVDEWSLNRTSGEWGDTKVTVVARGTGSKHEIVDPKLWAEIRKKRDYVIGEGG